MPTEFGAQKIRGWGAYGTDSWKKSPTFRVLCDWTSGAVHTAPGGGKAPGCQAVRSPQEDRPSATILFFYDLSQHLGMKTAQGQEMEPNPHFLHRGLFPERLTVRF